MDMELLAQQVLKNIFIELEASGRHVHVTKEQAMTLFGHSLSNERVTVKGPKGEFTNVAVLGPERKEAQVEISLTDGRTLGLAPPVRPSGDVTGSPGAVLVGPCGSVTLQQGVIAAQRHIHITPQDAARFKVQDKQIVKLQTFTDRPVIFEDVLVRVSKDFATAAHLDYDEANACGFADGDFGRIIL